MSINEGETATFECELNLEGRTVKWFHEGQEVGEKPDKRYQVLTEGTVHRLVVKDAIMPDAGEVMAKVEDKSTHAELTVEGKMFILNKKALLSSTSSVVFLN